MRKNNLKWLPAGHFGFYFREIFLGYPCVRPYILVYIPGPAIIICFMSYVEITKLLKFKMAAKNRF